MRLKNETAIITGSTTGIGYKLAEIFLREGCKVVICSRTTEKVERALSELKKQFREAVIGYSCDVTKPEQLNQLVEKTTEAFGSVRILVANAGVNTIYGPFDCLSTKKVNDYAKTIIGVNLIGTINSISAVLSQMKKQQYGRIVTLSGGGVDRPIDNMTLYSASKGGVVTFSKCLAYELEDQGLDIKINIFHPGMIKTNLISSVTCVPNWKSEEEIMEDMNFVIEHIGGDIEKRCRPVVPYVMPSCKANGKVFRGYSLFKLIIRAIRMQRQLKKRNRKKN
ncbi:MAG: SDR family NAD(P)-dependent oxidoreductase [Candidatus Heimdallarchaeota archaeon]|nr:SDR family NAD(P)-dependent oxidoreductase [Candidatus Heimdallarchaeota archaeon]